MQNLAVIQPIENTLRISAQELIEKSADIIIFTRNDLSQATDLAKQIKSRIKMIEDEREKIVKPINEGVKQVNSRFKMIREPLEQAETQLKAKMLDFQKAEQKREEEAQRKAAAKVAQIVKENPQANMLEELINMPPVSSSPHAPSYKPTTYGQSGATSTVKKVWKFEVTDIGALAKARPDLVEANQVRINQEIRGQGGNIPGLRIYQEDVIQVR